MRGRLSLDPVLDRRLASGHGPGLAAPLVVALSGGGDSVALLALTVEWAARRGRRVLALTVDHGLNPDSARWSAFAAETARALGADWRGLRWEGDKPTAGLPAAARAARHALLADAARQAGAAVILMAHTRDDIAEGEAMRADGVPLGTVREWAPSPVWPEGRGVFLFRPLLGLGRAALREELTARGLAWVEDPANVDPRFHRARVRLSTPSPAGEKAGPEPLARPPSPSSYELGEGLLELPRDISVRLLAAALVCASGQDRPPRGEALARLHARLPAGAPFTATLAGARVQLCDERLLVVREPGRAGLPTLTLEPGVPTVWDGRFEVTAETPCEIRPLAGLAAQLSRPDRAWLAAVPAGVRPTLPILRLNGTLSPVLAFRGARVSNLVADRFKAACGEFTHERELVVSPRGAGRPAFLC